MADDNKVYVPETIADVAFPIDGEVTLPAAGSTVAASDKPIAPSTTGLVDRFPQKFVPPDVRSRSLDTISKRILGDFSFGTLGAISIGAYVSGVSGDVRISPTGILGRNAAGETTFGLDATTGNASFKGTISAGTVIAGATNVKDASVVLDGENGRIVISDGITNRIVIGNV